jgi:hypothetical protein
MDSKRAEDSRARSREWREKNKEKVLEYTKDRYIKNKEQILINNEKWRAKNKEKVNRWRKEWRANTPDLEKERRKRHRKTMVENITKSYISIYLQRPVGEISNEQYEATRELLKVKRLIKELSK